MGQTKGRAKHRKEFRFYKEDLDHLENLREQGESDTDVIRRCLRLASTIGFAQESAQTFLVRDQEGNVVFAGSFQDFYLDYFLPYAMTLDFLMEK